MTQVAIRLRPSPANRKNIILRRVRILRGVSRGSTGTALPFSDVHLFRTSTRAWIASALSDANGEYTFNIHDRLAYYVVSTKYTEYRFDMNAITFDSTEDTFDASQVAGVTANNMVGA